jgi:hypothetical protein
MNTSQELVDSDNIGHTDVAMFDGTIFVVWEDDNSGTVKYQIGTYNSVAQVALLSADNQISVSPNPSSNAWKVNTNEAVNKSDFEITNSYGQVLDLNVSCISSRSFSIENHKLPNGIYFLQLKNHGKIVKMIKQ